MQMNRLVVTLFLLGVVFLTACSVEVGFGEPSFEDDSPSAADINAAAERTAQETVPTAPEDALEEAQVTEVEEPPSISAATDGSVVPSKTPAPLTNPRVEVPDVFVNWLLPWDGIRPIYDPQFASAAEAALDDDELVIGISIDGKAKAYPISVLRFREMVNDELAGIPILVTW
jgi:hypothetical protein